MKKCVLTFLISFGFLSGYQNAWSRSDNADKYEHSCGLNGSLEERIINCSIYNNSETKGFVLVTRSLDFGDIYKELSSGLIWSERIKETSDFKVANSACKEFITNITGLNWRLPTIEEYMEAHKSGIKTALPNMTKWFWSSSVHRINKYDHGDPMWYLGDVIEDLVVLRGFQPSDFNLSVQCLSNLQD